MSGVRGCIRLELTSLPVRFWPVLRYRNYLIVYAPEQMASTVIRILHDAVDIRSRLEQEG
jgi:hypothetical protein